MRSGEVLRLARGALVGHGRRTGLTLLGIAIGVAAVLLLTSLGEGARNYVRGEFRELGSNLIGILPGKTETSGALPGTAGGTPHDLTIADAQALHLALPDALLVAPISLGSAEASHGERRRDALVIGSTEGFLRMHDLKVRSGRGLAEGSWDDTASEVVIGARIASELFPGENPVGGTMRVGGWRMRVVGVLAPKGLHLGMDFDELVLAPVASTLALFDESSLFRIAVRMKSGSDMEAAKRRVLGVLVARHGEEDVTLLTEDAVVGALSAILDTLTIVLVGIAAISLAVSGLGVMNVMLVSVSERTSEVGLLKALGARPRQVMALFLAEAVIISAAGGLAGLALGYGLVRAMVLVWPVFPASPPWWAVVAAVLTSLLVGVVFGALPARRAMRLDPVAALSRR